MVDKIGGGAPPLQPPKKSQNSGKVGKTDGNLFEKNLQEVGKGEVSGKTIKGERVDLSGQTAKSEPSQGVDTRYLYLKPESREEKLARISKAIQEGTYLVSPHDVADRMLKIVKDPELLRLFALKDEAKIKEKEGRLLPNLDETQKKHYLALVKKVEGNVDLDKDDLKFIDRIRAILQGFKGES